MLLAAVFLVRDLADHLERLLVRLGAGVGVVDAGHARHPLGQFLGETRAGDGAGGAREIGHLQKLVADGIGDAFAPVSDVHGPDAARDGVEMFLAGRVPDAHALAFDHDARVDRFERLVLDQVVPDMGAIGLDHVGDIVRNGRHGQDSSERK